MTLEADGRPGRARSVTDLGSRPMPKRPDRPPYLLDQPVEFWPTSAICSALEGGDIVTWKKIAVALRRDPYGRTARQVEEVLDNSRPYGISNALAEVLNRARAHLRATECAEVARHVQLLLERSGLGPPEFASRTGVRTDELVAYLDAEVSPSASLMIRMRRLSDRFVKLHSRRPPAADDGLAVSRRRHVPTDPHVNKE